MQRGSLPVALLFLFFLLVGALGFYYFNNLSNGFGTTIKNKQWSKLKVQKGGYEFEYPSGWNVLAGELISVSSPETKNDRDGNQVAGIVIITSTIGDADGLTASQFIERYRKSLEGGNHGQYAPEIYEEIIVDGNSAIKYKGPEIPFAGAYTITVMITRGDDSYNVNVLYTPSEREQEANEILDHVIQSWKFLY